MSEIKRRIESIEMVMGCTYNGKMGDQGYSMDKCKECSFHNGIEDGKVVCLYNQIWAEGDVHVTQFVDNGFLYKSRKATKAELGKYDGENGNYICQLCCFNKKLINGETICEMGLMGGKRFGCYHNEIWEKVELTDETKVTIDDNNEEDTN